MKKLFLSFLFKILKSDSEYVLKKFNPQIIAVTGSIAKSSTKEAIFAVLREKFRNNVWKSYGNLNTKFGIPLAILGFKRSPKVWEWPYFILRAYFKSRFIKRYPKILILEWAADKPGDFKDLLSYIKPKISVITIIGPAHLEFFKNIKGLFQEKTQILKYLPKNGYAVLNINDKSIKKMKSLTNAEVRFFNGEGFNIANKAAEEIGKIYKIQSNKIQKTLKSIKNLEGRMNLIRGYRNCKIIDDSYNSNPLSASMALDFLEKISSPKGRKIAILGDMLELGDYTRTGHSQIFKKAKKISDVLILVGDNFKPFVNKEYWYQNSRDALKNIKEIILPDQNDVILIKGSRKIKMEKIVEELKG